MTRTELDLWRRWCDRRDQGAFRALVAAHEAFVYDFARRLTKHAADAEDLAQEAFLELAEADRERPPAVGMRAFLGRRLVLGARMLKRASLTRRRLEPKARAPAPIHPDNIVENREAAETALAELDSESRQALVLRFLHGLSYAEVAHVLGVQEGAARVRVHRGLGRLKVRFGSKAEASVAGLLLFVPREPLAASTTKAAVLLGGAVVMSTAKKVLIAALVVLFLGSGTALWRASRNEVIVHPRSEATREPVERSEPVAPVAAPRSEPVPLDRPIPTGRASVSGVLRFRDGSPVAGQQLSLSGSSARIVETDAQGSFHIHDEWVGERDLVFRGPNGYSLSIDKVKLKQGDRVEVVIDEGFDLSATVIDAADGKPVAGANVRLNRAGEGSDTRQAKWGWVDTDVRGQFRFRHVPAGEYQLDVVSAGREAFRKRLLVDGDVVLPVALQKARVLIVKFRNLPAAWRGAYVYLSITEAGEQRFYLDFQKEIDEHDEIRVDAPPPGRYRAELLPGRSPLPRMRIEEFGVAEESVDPIVFDFPAGARVVGTVTLPDGTAMANARIELEDREIGVRTDAEGGFVLPFVAAGANRLFLRVARGTHLAVARIDVPANGALRVNVRVRGTATVQGRVLTDSPAQWWLVDLHRKGEEKALARSWRNGSGKFTIPYLEAGEYELRVWAKGADWLKLPVVVDDGAQLDMGDIRPAAFPSFGVRVMVPDGREIPATFAVTLLSRNPTRVHTGRIDLGRDGRGFLRGIPEGEGTLRFEASGFERIGIKLKLRRGMAPVEIALTAAPVKLVVAFQLDLKRGVGVPLVMQALAKGRGGTPDGWAVLIFDTGPERGRLEGLPAGSYTLQFREPGFVPKDVDIEIVANDQERIRVRLEKSP